jgi:hypothetical protein
MIAAQLPQVTSASQSNELDSSSCFDRSSAGFDSTTNLEEIAELAASLAHEALNKDLNTVAVLKLEGLAVLEGQMPIVRGAIQFVGSEVRCPDFDTPKDAELIAMQINTLRETLDHMRLAEYFHLRGYDGILEPEEISFDDKARLVASSLVDAVTLFGDTDALKTLESYCTDSSHFSYVKHATNGALLRNGNFENPLSAEMVNGTHLAIEFVADHCRDIASMHDCMAVQPSDQHFEEKIAALFRERFRT